MCFKLNSVAWTLRSRQKFLQRYSSFVCIHPHLHDGMIFIWRPEGGIWIELGQALLLPPPSDATTINLKFLCLHTGQNSSHESVRVFPRFPPIPHIPLTVLCCECTLSNRRISQAWWSTVDPTIYYTRHCSPWFWSRVWSQVERALWFTSLQNVKCTEFLTLAPLPSWFIFSKRLLGLYNVTLMRQGSGCAPSGSNLFFFFHSFSPNCNSKYALLKMQAPTQNEKKQWNLFWKNTKWL